jgi:hypothetical protein
LKIARLLVGAALLGLGGCMIRPSIPTWRAPAGDQLTLAARDGFILPADINGQAVRLRVDTGYSDIILNPAVAQRLGLRPSLFGADLRVGPVKVQGRTGRGTVAIGSARQDRHISWFDRNVADDADGVINIAHLPYAATTLTFGAKQAGEVTTSVATTPLGFWSVAWHQPVGDRKVEVRMLLDAPRTMLTAASGAMLGETHGGAWAGEPAPHRIAFDVTRPAREMRFASPVPLQLLSLDRALVRTSDNRGKYVLPSDPAADPNEIVVTGNVARGSAYLTVILGRDQLAGCSSLAYERATRLLSLSCLPRN